MEVLDNGNPVKNNEDQMSGGNYTCRLPRDLNIGSGSVARSKGESDVRLLVACKTQLSSEVIKWKTESLRLQKERDAARVRARELDKVIGKYSEKAKELENRLSLVENENKRLRGKENSSSNASALQELSSNLDKFHSYPWPDTQTNPPSSCMGTKAERKSLVPQGDWQEVSQQLLKKMKQEMKELQELSFNFSSEETNDEEVKTSEREVPDVKACDGVIEESLSGLISETNSIKHCLLEQRSNLKTLLNKLTKGNAHVEVKDGWKNALRVNKPLQSNTAHSIKPKPSMCQSSRHSDDSFHEFFTKHLEGCPNIDKMSKTMQLLMLSDSKTVPEPKRSPAKPSSPKSAKPLNEKMKKASEEERVCPICQAPFDDSIPQNEFEDHVLDHLEVESASLLDQYVVL